MNVTSAGTRPLLASLIEIAEDDEDFIREVVGVFLRETPLKLAKLRSAIECEDVDAVVEYAHSLKGSALALDADRVSALSESLEHTARRGSLDGAAVKIAELEHEVGRLRPIFECICSEQSSTH